MKWVKIERGKDRTGQDFTWFAIRSIGMLLALLAWVEPPGLNDCKYLSPFDNYLPKPFMAFLRTTESLSGSAPGKSLMDPLNPLWENNTGLLKPHIRQHHANTLSGYFHGSLIQDIQGKRLLSLVLFQFFIFIVGQFCLVHFSIVCLITLLYFFCASLFLNKNLV